MPYRRNIEIPDAVKGALPSSAQTLWRTTFNAIYEQAKQDGKSDKDAETFAFQIAWTNVKKKFEKGEDGKWHAIPGTKELSAGEIRFGIEQVLNGRGALVAEGPFWMVTDVMLDGTAIAELFGDEMREPGDMRRHAIQVRWAVEDDVVKVTDVRPGVLRQVFVPLTVEREQAATSALPGTEDARQKSDEPPTVLTPMLQIAANLLSTHDTRTEEFEDTFRIKTPQRMKDVIEGRATSAVFNTFDRETKQPRWITVSSGTFPDRTGEIVAKEAQEFALAWAKEHKMYGPLRLAHVPHPVPQGADLRAQWKALVGDYVAVFDQGLLPMLDMNGEKGLRYHAHITPSRARNLISIVGKDLAKLVVDGVLTADVGTCDYQTLQGGSNPEYPGRFLVESGLWDDTPLAHKARNYFDTHTGEVSIGFLFDHMSLVLGKDDRVYPSYDRRMWRFERSLLPMGAAAFPAGYLDGAVSLPWLGALDLEVKTTRPATDQTQPGAARLIGLRLR